MIDENPERNKAYEEHSSKCMAPRPVQEVSRYHFNAGYDHQNEEVKRLRRYLSCSYHHPFTILRNHFCNKCGWSESEFRKI